jgi:hypothetical protein
VQHASGRHFSLQHPTPCNCNALQGNRVENLVQAVQALPLYGIEVSPLPLKGSTAGCHPALSACPPTPQHTAQRHPKVDAAAAAARVAMVLHTWQLSGCACCSRSQGLLKETCLVPRP